MVLPQTVQLRKLNGLRANRWVWKIQVQKYLLATVIHREDVKILDQADPQANFSENETVEKR